MPPEVLSTAPDWFIKLVPWFNSFVADVAGALTGRLNDENLARKSTPQFRFSTDGSSVPYSTIKFRNDLATAPKEVRVAQILPVASGDSITGAVTCPWWQVNDRGEIVVNFISGLSANKEYKIVFVYE